MTRIIAGSYGGRRLRTPSGTGTRPTTDRVREALFSALESEFGGLAGVRFLDLFAGSGAIGLEAASRGAARVDLVESDRRAAQIINANVALLGCPNVRVAAVTAERFSQAAPAAPYEVIFLDPPYAYPQAALAALLRVLGTPAWRAADGLVVVERSKRDEFAWPAPLAALRSKHYGETILWYGR